MTARVYNIEDDTPILPAVIADSVVSEVERVFNISLSRAHADALARRQSALYQGSASWRKKMRARGNSGRDSLYAFMRHWLSADIARSHPRVSAALAHAAWDGEMP